jgi:hypothetical protein
MLAQGGHLPDHAGDGSRCMDGEAGSKRLSLLCHNGGRAPTNRLGEHYMSVCAETVLTEDYAAGCGRRAPQTSHASTVRCDPKICTTIKTVMPIDRYHDK